MIKVGDCDVCLVYAAACCSMGVGGYSYERARFLLTVVIVRSGRCVPQDLTTAARRLHVLYALYSLYTNL